MPRLGRVLLERTLCFSPWGANSLCTTDAIVVVVTASFPSAQVASGCRMRLRILTCVITDSGRDILVLYMSLCKAVWRGRQRLLSLSCVCKWFFSSQVVVVPQVTRQRVFCHVVGKGVKSWCFNNFNFFGLKGSKHQVYWEMVDAPIFNWITFFNSDFFFKYRGQMDRWRLSAGRLVKLC